MAKGAMVNEIAPGQKVEGLFCVSSKALRTTKAGSPFVSLTLSDKSGQIEARIWDNANELAQGFEKGDIVLVEAEAVEFNGQCQLKVMKVDLADEVAVDPAHFLPVSSCDLERAWRTCKEAMKEVKDVTLSMLLREIFGDKKIIHAFRHAPAAKKMHHAYIGGLLEHTANLIDLTRLVLKKYHHLQSDLLLSACLLHDLGKIKELSWQRPPIEYTDEGRLLGHIGIGIEMIERACVALGIDAGNERILALKHIVLSHHGQKEFGSPVLPMTEEAMVFHMLDDLDAKLNFISGLKEMRGEHEDWGWSDYQHLFERYFFLPPTKKDNGVLENMPTNPKEKADGGPIQPSLWRDDEP